MYLNKLIMSNGVAVMIGGRQGIGTASLDSAVVIRLVDVYHDNPVYLTSQVYQAAFLEGLPVHETQWVDGIPWP